MVQTCPSCGEENPDRFRLCGFCGTVLVAQPPAQEVRKTVTIVFCDLKGSTELADRLDSEAVREVLALYFSAMKPVLERHGGTIEKYIGDAIMAVFGLPRMHEDDALRAVRAAAEMRGALEELNVTLRAGFGVTLENRTGVNTGEVVTGDTGGSQPGHRRHGPGRLTSQWLIGTDHAAGRYGREVSQPKRLSIGRSVLAPVTICS